MGPKFVGSACVACASTADSTTTDVCSTATPNTCVAVGSSDATCAAIDAAKPKFLASNGGSCVVCLITADCTTTDVCSTATANTCVAVGSSDATCAAIDAATPKWSTSNTCAAAAANSPSPSTAPSTTAPSPSKALESLGDERAA